MFVVVGEALVDLVGQRAEGTLESHAGGSPADVALSDVVARPRVGPLAPAGPEEWG